MPAGDGIRPVGQGRAGIGLYRGADFAGPEGEYRCPTCRYHEPHQRGFPCNTKKCPKCNTQIIRT